MKVSGQIYLQVPFYGLLGVASLREAVVLLLAKMPLQLTILCRLHRGMGQH